MNIIKSPFAILIGAFAGAYVGYAFPEFGPHAKPWGTLYLSALKMSVVPFIFIAVSLGISSLFMSENKVFSFGKLLSVFGIFLVGSSFVGAISAFFLKPGDLHAEQISKIIKATGFVPAKTITLSEPIELVTSGGFTSFISNALPDNIFGALASGQVLQIISFAVIFGAALGIYHRGIKKPIPPSFAAIQHILQKIIGAVVSFLPFGIFFLLADQISAVDSAIFSAMIRFLGMAVVMFIILTIISSLLIWQRSGMGYIESVKALQQTLILVLSTSSSLVGMPAAIEALHNKMGMSYKASELSLPLGVSVCRYGTVAYFAFVAVFISQVYQIPLSVNEYIMIITGAVIAGLTTSGLTGIATLPMIGLVLEPIGLPLSAVLALLIAIDPIMDPFRSMTVLYINCASTTFVAKPPAQKAPSKKATAT
ncbi:dicarboxylate/amino acid:cation symporter [Alphaproteobacteria bacterium]|nr:dicarboxylate/amino acid:cation symporter [Alphaproteobacteria bacterium]